MHYKLVSAMSDIGTLYERLLSTFQSFIGDTRLNSCLTTLTGFYEEVFKMHLDDS